MENEITMPYLMIFSDQELNSLYEGLKSIRVTIHAVEGRNSCPGARLVIVDQSMREDIHKRIRLVESEMKRRPSFNSSPFIPFSLYSDND